MTVGDCEHRCKGGNYETPRSDVRDCVASVGERGRGAGRRCSSQGDAAPSLQAHRLGNVWRIGELLLKRIRRHLEQSADERRLGGYGDSGPVPGILL